MAIIRITEHVDGIENYLTHGNKKGRLLQREQLDQRVPIYGNIEVFKAVNCYVQKHKNWKNNYWHITISPAWIHHDMPRYELRQIVISTLEYYFHLYQRERLAAYAEIHYPRQQSTIDPETQEVKQRLPHVHLVVSKLDTWTDNQLRILPYKKSVAAAFQTWLNHQHPANTGMQYLAVAQHALQIVQDYQSWHRQHNEVDLETITYAPHMLLQSMTWQYYAQPDANSQKAFKRLNSRLPRQSDQYFSRDQFDVLQGFRQWINDVSIWYAEYQAQALLNRRTSIAAILREAEDKFGLIKEYYQVNIQSSTQEEIVFDTRTGKEYSAVYFAYDILHMNMKEALKWLKQLDPDFDQVLAEQVSIDGMQAIEEEQQQIQPSY